MSNPYIPRKDGDFNEWFKALVQYVSSKVTKTDKAWKHIPTAAVTALAGAYTDWYNCYSACFMPHVRSVTKAKSDARKRAENEIRKFKKQYLDVDEVNNLERVDMRLPAFYSRRTPIADPTVAAAGDILFSIAGIVEIINIRPIAQGDYDRRALQVVDIAYGILSAGTTNDKLAFTQVPLSPDDLPHSEFTGKKKFKFKLQGESGNTIFICMRYKNLKGGKGPWGPMYKAIIP